MKEKIINLFKKFYNFLVNIYSLFINFLKKKYFLTSVLMFLSFPTFDYWFLKGYTFFAWISLVPIFYYVRGKDYKEIIFSAFIAGLFGNLFAYNWIGYFGVGVGGGGGYVLVLSFLTLSLAVFFTTKILIAEYLSRRFEFLRIIIYPSVWIFIDWIQSIGYLAFPWTYWGYSQFEFTSFIQISSVFGIMGVTFIIVLFNYILSEYFLVIKNNKLNFSLSLYTKEFKKLAGILILLIIIISLGVYKLSDVKQPEKRDLRFAIIQSCISPWEHWRLNRFRYLAELEHYTKLSLEDDPDLIIWSESATLENISFNYEHDRLDSFESRVLDIARFSNKSLLTGEIGKKIDNSYYGYSPQNNAVLINEEGHVVKAYSKINLVPFGEWFPYEKWLPYIKELSLKMGGSSFVPGDKPVSFEFRDNKFGVLVCYEGIFFRLCREYKKLGADFFVNITNDGWTDSYAGHIQHFSASVFRAIENGIWYIRAGNTGLSAFIDPYGRVICSIPILKKNYLVGDVDFDLNHETFYSKYGDVFLYGAMIFVGILFAGAGFLQIRSLRDK